MNTWTITATTTSTVYHTTYYQNYEVIIHVRNRVLGFGTVRSVKANVTKRVDTHLQMATFYAEGEGCITGPHEARVQTRTDGTVHVEAYNTAYVEAYNAALAELKKLIEVYDEMGV